ncbi:hypothetical protein GY45DRAFT_1348464 [Cubamyces sp. BRFM 1775]|nr:hypothetical protein GY45DRAFT_1348464 [Cubamyces sp. BRFM 1775]
MPYSASNSRLLLIDNRDPAVQYAGTWEREEYWGDMLSTAYADNSSVSLEFDGTRIMVATLAVPESVNYSFAPKLQFVIDDEVVDTFVPDPFVNWTFYSIFDRQGLKDGTHTINITVLETSDDYPFFLDGFMFQPSQKYWNLAFAPENLEVDSGNSTKTATAGSSSKPPVGAIVGGTLGGLLLVGLACAAFFWWWRKKQHVYMSLDGHDEPKRDGAITPFTSTRPASIISTDSKHAYSKSLDASLSPTTPRASGSTPIPSPSYPSLLVPPPSEFSHANATMAPSDASESYVGSAPGATGYDVHEAPHLHSIHGRVGIAPSGKARRPSMADMVQAALQVARTFRAARRAEVADPEATPTEAPPLYSER